MCWFKPSITIVLMNCQFSWQSVVYLSTPWDLVWEEAKCRIRKVCHFQMSSGTTEARFWFLKGTHVLQLATPWVRQKPFPCEEWIANKLVSSEHNHIGCPERVCNTCRTHLTIKAGQIQILLVKCTLVSRISFLMNEAQKWSVDQETLWIDYDQYVYRC